MPIQKQLIQPVGMMQDNLITSPKSNQFAHEIKNLRFNTQGDYVTASWSVEQSTLYKEIKGFDKGYLENQMPVGQAVINDQWILFTTRIIEDDHNEDFIIKLRYSDTNPDTLEGEILYKGWLNFNTNNPLETITFFESEDVQKVYWTDNINQPRVINITKTYKYNSNEIDSQFDFVTELSLNENVSVYKQQGGAGQFPPCTVKYAITYYKKYGQESNIVWTSTLLYPTKGDRGLKEDELSGDIFVIKVDNVDLEHDYDYIRLYSIVRTTGNATPVVRIVESKSLKELYDDSVINKTITFYDSNTTGEIIDPTILNYVGGYKIAAETFDQKNNTLFLGNITLKTQSLKEVVEDHTIDWSYSPQNIPNGFTTDVQKNIIVPPKNVFYQYKNQMNEGVKVRTNPLNSNTGVGYLSSTAFSTSTVTEVDNPKIFKYGEWYRFGIQCQDKNGVWSDVAFLQDVQNNIAPTGVSQQNAYSVKIFPVYRHTIRNIDALNLIDAGYKKARLVCCYPTNNDRSVLAQGVICAATYNEYWKEKHAPDYFGSWFYEFIADSADLIAPNNYIQSLSGKNTSRYSLPTDIGFNTKDPIPFKVTNKVLTFHSPEIEFDDSIKTLDWSKLKLREIGTVTRDLIASNMYLDYSKQAQDYLGYKGRGFIDNSNVSSVNNIYSYIDSNKKTLYKWNDINVYNANLGWKKGNGGQIKADTYDYPIYPFQRKYLNNYMGDLDRPVVINNGTDIESGAHVEESSIINNKIYSELIYSSDTNYLSPTLNIDYLEECKLFDSTEVLPLVFKDKSIYYGNINTLIPTQTKTSVFATIYTYQGLRKNDTIPDIDGCNVKTPDAPNDKGDTEILQQYKGFYFTSDIIETRLPAYSYLGVSYDPIRIAYKSTPHCVLKLKNNYDFSPDSNTLYLVELYRDVDASQRFGGNSEEALLNNVFVPCGKAVDLDNKVNGYQTDITLIGDIGDTYYMRYDHLKTYPYTREEVNGIVEILSFMCETRINLDGRCDVNRGLTDNTLIDNTNFNYINKSYTQIDNFFNYRVLGDDTAKRDKFPNQITWTKTKNADEEVDTWTNITLASVADAEGTLGKITKILNNKNRLYMFQEHGIAMLGYNEKTAISVTNGVPLEIANSGKFTGFDYLTKDVGCQNKWSINNSKNGILWIDNSRRELNTFTENGVTSLSTLHGFDSFIINNIENKPTVWNPSQFMTSSSSNFVTYYDELSKDIYYINREYCLAWNEITNTFTSFYDYNNVPYMSNISQHSLMAHLDGFNTKIYAAREGRQGNFNSYGNFFGVDKPYWITLLANGGSDSRGNYTNADKIFNTIEYKGDLFDENQPVLDTPATYLKANKTNITNMINMPLFTDIAAYNGYQAYKEFKIDGRYSPKNYIGTRTTTVDEAYREYPWQSERKFNMWRTIIPRATYNNPDGTLYTNRDRIRNPYTYIKLINNEPQRPLDIKVPIGYRDAGTTNHGVGNHRAIFSDFIVSFDMK